MNLALFGGSFDPPHLGHDSIVKMALSTLDIEKLIIIPTFTSPFKQNFSAPPSKRLEWINKIWSNLEKVEISDYEIKQNRPVPTIQTVKYLSSLYSPSNFYLIIGADHIPNLKKWHDYDELCDMVKFIIAQRDGFLIPKSLKTMDIHVNISSSQIRKEQGLEKLDNKIKHDVIKFYQGKYMNNENSKSIEKIISILDEKKAEEIQVFDMSDKEYFVRNVVIATTLAQKHALSLSEELQEKLKPLGEKFIGVETSDDWVVLDMGDTLIHLMSAEYRAKYNIEDLLNKIKENKEGI